MKLSNKILSALLVFLIVSCVFALPGEANSYRRITRTHGLTLKKTEDTREKKVIHEKPELQYDPKTGLTLVPLDLTFDPSSTFVFQGTPDPNVINGREVGTSWVIYLDFIKKFGDWGVAFFELKYGLGNALASSLDMFNYVNYNSDPMGGNVKVHVYWYKQFLFDRQLSILSGKVLSRGLFAQNEYAGDDDMQFLGYIFNESPVIEWPSGNTFTINADLCLKSMDFLEYTFNYWEGDADFEKIFKGGIYAAQVNIKPSRLFDMDKTQWDGNYRFYTWLNTGFHTKLVKFGGVPASFTKEYNYGFGLSFDQMVTDVYGVFLRCGFQRPDLVPVDGGTTIAFSWATGGQMTGKYWGRENDILAIGVGQVVPSQEYIDAGNDGRTEGHLEAYYSFALTRYLFISPDMQLVWNPDGASVKETDPIFVYGFRVHADF